MDNSDTLPVSTADQQSAGHLCSIREVAFLKEPLQCQFITFHIVLASTCNTRTLIKEFVQHRAQTADQSSHTHTAVSTSFRVPQNYMHRLVQRLPSL